MFAMEQVVVQVIENRADIKGRVLAIAPIAARPDHRLLTIEVSGVSSVEGYANMFASAPGARLDVIVPAPKLTSCGSARKSAAASAGAAR
jgi:hypothetical protein